MKSTQNYSINVVVLENFNDIVPAQTRSAVIEALMIAHMVGKKEQESKVGSDGINNAED